MDENGTVWWIKKDIRGISNIVSPTKRRKLDDATESDDDDATVSNSTDDEFDVHAVARRGDEDVEAAETLVRLATSTVTTPIVSEPETQFVINTTPLGARSRKRTAHFVY